MFRFAENRAFSDERGPVYPGPGPDKGVANLGSVAYLGAGPDNAAARGDLGGVFFDRLLVLVQQTRARARPCDCRCTLHVDLGVDNHFATAAFDPQGNRQAVAKRGLTIDKETAAIEHNGPLADDIACQELDISD